MTLFDPLRILWRRLHWWLPVTRLRYAGRVEGRRVLIDYADIRGARFEGCEIVYRGSTAVLKDNAFSRCTFSLGGAAGNAAIFMRALAAGGGEDVIRKTFGFEETAGAKE